MLVSIVEIALYISCLVLYGVNNDSFLAVNKEGIIDFGEKVRVEF